MEWQFLKQGWLSVMLILVYISNEVVSISKLNKVNKLHSTTTSSKRSSSSKINTCQDEKCKKTAERILKNMDLSVEPCNDFYRYACGGWVHTHPIPKTKDEYSSIVELSEANDKVLKGEIKHKHKNDSITILKVKNLYRSCMDEKRVNTVGKGPLVEFIKKLGSWPLFPDWKEDQWDFDKHLRMMHREYPAEIFFTVDVDVDPENRTKNIITIDQAKLCLPQIVYYVNFEAISTLREYAVTIAKLAGATVDVEKQIKDVVAFEVKLAKILAPKPSKRYSRIPIVHLAAAIPQFPWLEHLRSVFHPRDVRVNETVIVLTNDYLADLVSLFKDTPKRVLCNYMMWRMVKDMVPFLSKDFTDAYHKFRSNLTGKPNHKSRHEICFRYTDEILGPLVGSMFIRQAFTHVDKDEVEEMMRLIINAFIDNAEHVPWISEQTIKSVKEKARAAVYQVGYPEYLRNETLFEERYKEINIDAKTFFWNVVSIDKFSNKRTFRKLDKAVDLHQWVSVPHMANAFYVVTKNEIVIPAGILQPPFFYGEPVPRSVSYGAIGHVLGHELTHGFDTLGRKFNKIGEMIQKRTKWSDPSIEKFETSAKCLVSQFDQFKVDHEIHVDGQNTLGENIADGGGVKIAYLAYQRWVKDFGKEPTLPLLNKTNEQLFFIGYAQKECHNSTHKAIVDSVKEDVHAPSMFRILGTLSNSKYFQEAFSCKTGSPMAPKKRCDVW